MKRNSPNDFHSLDDLSELDEKLVDKRQNKRALAKDSDQSTLAEHCLLTAAVAWEGFISDILIAYINVDASRFKTHLEASFDKHIKTQEKQNRIFTRFGKLQFPMHLSKADVQSLANSSGNNITFPNFSELEKKASIFLVQAHADKFTKLSKPQKSIIDAVIALRNHVAHRSERSLKAMNEALASGELHTTGIKRNSNKFHNVGAWLKAKPVGRSEPRLLTILASLEVIGTAC